MASGLLHVGLSLQAAIELPHDAAVQRIADPLHSLDDTIREIREHISASRDHEEPPLSGLPNGAG